MAFNTQEQEIIKFGASNGKSRAEVEQAISNYRAGIVPKKKVEEPLQPQEPSLGSKLVDRAKTAGKEALNIATLGASTLTSQDVQEARQDPTQTGLVALQAFNRAFQAPAEIAKAAGGAIGDVIGAGLEATGVDKAIAKVVAPVVKPAIESEGAKMLKENFAKLPPQTQEYLKGIPDIANLIGLEAVPSIVAKTASKQVGLSAFDAIKGSGGNLTGKALDFISADPSKKVETILKRSTPEELDNYLSIAEKSSASGEAKSVFEAVGDKMFEATKELKTKLDGIGAAKSEVMAKNGNIDFTTQTAPFVSKLEDILNSFTKIDEANAPIVKKFIADAENIKTAQQADAFIDKAQDALYTGDRTMTLPKGSSLEKKLQKALGEYNTALKSVVPEEYAKLNKQYADLVGTLDVLNRGLGEVVEGTPIRGAGLVKQYFSPSASRTKELFEFIKKETDGRIDLAKDATLAKFAGQLYEDPNVNSLLGGIKDIPTTVGEVAGRVIEKVGGEKVTEALRRSTVQKAKSSTLPAESKSTKAQTTVSPESKVVPSTNSTPKPQSSKGIRGMIDFNEIGKAVTPKKVVSEVPKTVKVWIKSKFSNDGSYADVPVIRREDNITLYQGGSSEGRQFWTPDKKYAESFGEVTKKTGSFYKIDNGNRVTDVYVEVPKKVVSLEQEAKKYKSAEEFVKAQPTVYRGEGGSNVAQGKALLAEGKHFASDAEYPKGFGKVGEYVLKPNAKVLDLGDSTFAEISQKLGIPERSYISPKELSTIAKEKGYDVVKYTGEYKSTGKQFSHTVDLTGDSYVTKSQLTDIWNKANKK